MKSKGIEREEGLVVPARQRDTLQERGADIPGAIEIRKCLRRVEAGVDWGVGKQIVEHFQHSFGSPVLVEPVVD